MMFKKTIFSQFIQVIAQGHLRDFNHHAVTIQPPPPLSLKKKLGSTRITWVVPQRSENTEIRIYTEKSHP